MAIHAVLCPVDEKKLLETLQDFLQEGIVLVIGSGLSASYGIPGMAQLAAHLQANVPQSLTPPDNADWTIVHAKLNAGAGLENALQDVHISPTLLDILTRECAACIEDKERQALLSIAASSSISPLGRLVQHTLKAVREVHIITPNYDRLIECQIEKASIPIDTGYVGTYVARYDSARSALAHKEYVAEGRHVRAVHQRHVHIHKPHGSLDWYIFDNQVMRIPERLSLPRAIITPGLTKYRSGYSPCYEQQRIPATRVLEKAQRILVIGYGFNDDQLEQSWCPNLTTDKQLVILTRALTPNAAQIVQSCGTVCALCEDPANASSTQVYQSCDGPRICSKSLWHIEGFVKEVVL